MLMSELPVVELMLHCVEDDGSWHLRVAHRHFSGFFGECPAENYPRLTADELAELCEVVAFSYMLPTEGSSPEEYDEEPF